jgi:hypothetical protein
VCAAASARQPVEAGRVVTLQKAFRGLLVNFYGHVQLVEELTLGKKTIRIVDGKVELA